MRKKLCSIMFIVMSLALSACGTTATPSTSTEAPTVEETTADTITEAEVDQTTETTAEQTTEATEVAADNDKDTTDTSSTDEITTTTDIDSKDITVNYPSGYFEDDVDIVLEMDTEKTQANLTNSSDLSELFGSSLNMGSFLGIEDNGYFLMVIGAGVYYEGTWEGNSEEGFVANCKNMNSGEQESLSFGMDDESGQYVTTVYGEKIYWKKK